MIAKTGRKAVSGMLDRMDGLRDGGSYLAGKMGIGRPSLGRKAMGLLGPRPGMALLAALAAGIAGIGIWLYLRKRRQVADHYTMGEGEGGWETTPPRGYEPAESYRP